jgi:uncharacterized protein YueI
MLGGRSLHECEFSRTDAFFNARRRETNKKKMRSVALFLSGGLAFPSLHPYIPSARQSFETSKIKIVGLPPFVLHGNGSA